LRLLIVNRCGINTRYSRPKGARKEGGEGKVEKE
jgi:hypothetical protein